VPANALYQFQIKAPSSLARLRLLSILFVCLRRLILRRLDGIFDLKSELLTERPLAFISHRQASERAVVKLPVQ
jgi:hypothetical protein